jgi:hypothetical protein
MYFELQAIDYNVHSIEKFNASKDEKTRKFKWIDYNVGGGIIRVMELLSMVLGYE